MRKTDWPMLRPFERYLKDTFSIDVRSMALFRICLGMVLLIDLLDRIRFLEAFYTDYGFAPRYSVLEEFYDHYQFSLHFLTGDIYTQSFLFGFHLLVTLAFIIGFKTRWMTFFSWVLSVSLTNRNPGIIFGGDVVLRMILFWSMFVPLGLYYSVDAALNKVKYAQKKFFSAGSVGLLIQLLLVYVFAGLHKHHPQWVSDGTALAYALELDQFATKFGVWLRQFPGFLRALTHTTLILELFGPAMFLLPLGREKWRLFGVLAFCGLHLGIFFTMNVGLFPWMCISAWIIFLPSLFWDWLRRKSKSTRGAGYTIYYDGECGFCKKGVYLLKEFMRLHAVKLLPADVKPKILIRMHEENSWVIEDRQGKLFTKYRGFMQLLSQAPLPSFVYLTLKSDFSKWIGNKVYHWVSHHRRQVSAITACLRWKDQDYFHPRWMKWIVLLLLFEVVSICLGALDWPTQKLEERIHPLALTFPLRSFLRLDQSWAMFAPYPTDDDGWYIIFGKTVSGAEVNLWTTDYKHPYTMPEAVNKTFISHRWRKYLRNLRDRPDIKYRKYFGQYLCQKTNRNRQGEDKLDVVKIKFMHQRTSFSAPYPIEENTLWTHLCSGKAATINEVFANIQ
ncbi:MAG: HTTM domain-containing protein [Bdellovibrionota bacterium]